MLLWVKQYELQFKCIKSKKGDFIAFLLLLLVFFLYLFLNFLYMVLRSTQKWFFKWMSVKTCNMIGCWLPGHSETEISDEELIIYYHLFFSNTTIAVVVKAASLKFFFYFQSSTEKQKSSSCANNLCFYVHLLNKLV